MATQGQVRQLGISALRQLRRAYRRIDTAGEKVERELDRLVKRKTLVQLDDLATLRRLVDEWAQTAETFVLDVTGLVISIDKITLRF